MKEKLTSALGTTGLIIWYVISVVITFAPLTILRFSFIIDFIIIAVVTAVPFLGNIVSVVIWVWALIECIGGPQDIFAIIYYILFGLKAIHVVCTMLSSLRRN